MLKRRSFFLVAFLLLLVSSFCLAEEITITTYYPAPYGSYNELQLYPHSPSTVPCDASHVGVMYYDSSEDTLKICNSGSAWNSPGYWVLENAIPPATGEALHPKDLAWNVGIGVAAPTYKLDVGAASGQAAFYAHTAENRAVTAETSDNAAVYAYSSGSSGIGVQAWGNGFDFYANNAMGKSYLAGSLGIGIDAPLAKLHVRDGDAYFDGKVGIGTNAPESPLSVGGPGFLGTSGFSTWAIYGNSSEAGVYGEGDNTGVVGFGGRYGVVGTGTGTYGVVGWTSNYGVFGMGAYGIYGVGRNAGGYFSNDGSGTYALMTGNGQVYIGDALNVESFADITGDLYVHDGAQIDGSVGIGTPPTFGVALDVNGAIYQRGVALHPDYVFDSAYPLESIDEHSAYMWQNKHLKGIPEVVKDKDGKYIVEVGAQNRGLLEELEKAHIYIEQLNKRIKSLEEKLEKL